MCILGFSPPHRNRGLKTLTHIEDAQSQDSLPEAPAGATANLPGDADSVLQTYHRRREQFEADHQVAADQTTRWMHVRLIAFFAALGLFIAGLATAAAVQKFLLATATVAFAGFVAAVVAHRRARRKRDDLAVLRDINQHAASRFERKWKEIPEPKTLNSWQHIAFVRDLDLFGHASLSQLLGTAHTPTGRATVSRWLLKPADPPTIELRQQSVAELAPQLDLRQQFELLALPMAGNSPDTEPFVRWAESEPWLASRPGILWTARLLPLLTLTLAVIQVVGVSVSSLWLWVTLAGAAWWAWTMLAGIVISFWKLGPVHEIFAQISSREGEIRRYAQLFQLANNFPADSEELRRLKDELCGNHRGADYQLDRLARIVALADLRFSPMIYLPVQAFTLWDFHVLHLIEKWQRDAGPHARKWFSALGELEALSALSSVAHDHPRWVFPKVHYDVESNPTIVAEKLGHPLLSESSRVVNNVQLGPPGRFLLVTGSNMSGKSTLLRSIGANIVLAQAGGPVCAQRFEMPPVKVETSMRIQDSLEDGVSFFMAELKRLKEIVDVAQDLGEKRAPQLVYLLDEILLGTNSAERQTAVRRVMEHLLKHQAIGAITTHDLQLAESPALAEACVAVNFRESFDRDAEGRSRMTFDYHLREGIATTTNALRLLEMVGLGEASGDA